MNNVSKCIISSSKFQPQFTTAATIACSALISLSFITTNNNTHNTSMTKCSADEKNEESMFYNYFPKNQLFQPKKPYPAWDDNWDGKENKEEGENHDVDNGVTRHIILVRHGQYDETFKDDSKRKLTELGRQQAHATGKRLAEMIKGINDQFEACNVKEINVSDMTRAKETAMIISEYLPDKVLRVESDPLLNEGIPAQIIPTRPELKIEEDLAENGARIEKGFIKYFFRKTSTVVDKNDKTNIDNHNKIEKKNEKHEFEIIVCHGNVIRYFFCRALQLPPEAWLRMSIFNCSLTYLMIRPNGRVSCRMLGDIGHLGYGLSTFSMNHGFVW